MIGNDIIDLKYASLKSNTLRKGWLEKLFTEKEIATINNSVNRDQTIWLLWSQKEAVYKAHQRRFQFEPIFNPQAYIVNDNTVSIDSYKYITESSINDDYIHTIAYQNNVLEKEKITVFLNIKEFNFLDEIALKHTYLKDDLSIVKNKSGIPDICLKDKPLPFFYSSSHHGAYNAIIYI